MKPPFTAALWVPAHLYSLLALASALFGAFSLLPVARHLQAHPTSASHLVPQFIYLLILLAVVAFYTFMATTLYRRTSRRAAHLGACVSCLFFPFGTIVGLLVLLWTMRHWRATTLP